MRKPYPSDMTDEQWAILEPLIPVSTLGRPRDVEMREVLNAIFYQARSGCQWDMLPHDFPPKSTVFDYFKQWRDDGTWQVILDALRQQVRTAAEREPSPGAGSIDSQTVKGTRGRRRAGLRRRQEAAGPEAAHRRGQPGLAPGGAGDGGVGRRRHDGPEGLGPPDGRAPQPAGEGVGRRQVPQPLPERLAQAVRRSAT